MAEKTSELTKDATAGGGFLTESGKDIISTVADTSDRDAFIEKYSDDYAASDNEILDIETNTSEDAPEETEHLKAQIEETRSQMGETIDAIQEKLSFQNISEQVKEQVSEHISSAFETAKDTVYDATIKKAGNFMQSMNKSVNKSLDEFSKYEAVQIARANPLALSLIGLGVGLLLMNGYKKKSSYRYADTGGGNRGKDIYGSGGEAHNRNQPSMLKSAQDKITGTAASAYESVGNAASGAVDSVSNVAGSAYNSVTNAASTAYSGVTGAATSAYSNVGDYAGKAYEKVGDLSTQAREQYDYYIEENPLAVGAVALALGAAVGMALPSTRVEGQLMGEHKQQLLQKAQDTAGELVDKVKQVATEAQKNLTDEVKTQVQDLAQ